MGNYPYKTAFTTNKDLQRQFMEAGQSSSYSGVDIKAVVNVTPYNTGAKGGSKLNNLALANLQTITISHFREEYPVRSLGQVHAQGYTNGTRTIAGTMIFTLFDRQVLTDLMMPPYGSDEGIIAPVKGYEKYLLDNESIDISDLLIDQLPPFDITIICAGENGQISRAALYGVKINAGGTTMSIQDIMTETTVNYTARRYEPLKSLYNTFKLLLGSSQDSTFMLALKRKYDYVFSQHQNGIITTDMYMRIVSEINQQIGSQINKTMASTPAKTFNSIVREDESLQKMLRLSDNPFI